MGGHHGLDGGSAGGVEMTTGDELVSQGPSRVPGPGPERVAELGRVDQTDLEADQAEEEVAIGRNIAHGWGSRRSVHVGLHPPADVRRHRPASSDAAMIQHLAGCGMMTVNSPVMDHPTLIRS
jgi:hypothetical protein